MIPDFLEPITAWRAWRVQHNGLLSGLAAAQPWAPKRPLVAACNGHDLAKTGNISAHLTGSGEWVDAPALECVCGVYAARDRDVIVGEIQTYRRQSDDWGYVRTPAYAYGTVSLWGRVVEHPVGYRAQFAYPREITVQGNQEIADKVAALYGVPVGREDVPTNTVFDPDPWSAATPLSYGWVPTSLIYGTPSSLPTHGFVTLSFDDAFTVLEETPPLTFHERKERRKAEAAERHRQRLLQSRRGWKKSKPWP